MTRSHLTSRLMRGATNQKGGHMHSKWIWALVASVLGLGTRWQLVGVGSRG
jgi:hypothetical protein